jgi:hypothetical protein
MRLGRKAWGLPLLSSWWVFLDTFFCRVTHGVLKESLQQGAAFSLALTAPETPNPSSVRF